MTTTDNDVLYKLIESRISTLEDRLDTRFDDLEHRQTRLEESISILDRTIRGHNGSPGMLTDLALLKEKVELKCDEITEKSEKPENGSVSWVYVRDKAMLPIITAFAIWLLLTVLPNVVAHLGIGAK